MPEYLSPGVYLEESESGTRAIQGVSTDMAGFLGQAERGPVAPRLITSWQSFQQIFGSYIPEKSYLAYAVEGFFENGGRRCYVCRITHPKATHAYTVINNSLVISAIGPGKWGKEISVNFEAAAPINPGHSSDSEPRRIILTIQCNDYLEKHEVNYQESESANTLWGKINESSKLIRVWWQLKQVPANFFENVGKVLLGRGGANGGAVGAAHFTGSRQTANFQGPERLSPGIQNNVFGKGWGLNGLAAVEGISLLAIPDEVRPGFAKLTQYAIRHCEKQKYCFAVLSAPESTKDLIRLKPPGGTKNAAFYYPWIEIFDRRFNQARLVPPSGHLAGIFAYTDKTRGVHKAPAGAVVKGATGLAYHVSDEEQRMLNPKGVNCLRIFPRRGIRVWGARTVSSDPSWKYINIRRFMLYIEQSIEKGTQWIVFESNGDGLWARARQAINRFLITVWRDGALPGANPAEAFFVKCDRTTMTQDDIDAGRLICVIGIAPLKPAEFMILRISQMVGK